MLNARKQKKNDFLYPHVSDVTTHQMDDSSPHLDFRGFSHLWIKLQLSYRVEPLAYTLNET